MDWNYNTKYDLDLTQSWESQGKPEIFAYGNRTLKATIDEYGVTFEDWRGPMTETTAEIKEYKTTNFRIIVTFIASKVRAKSLDVIAPERPGGTLKVSFCYDVTDEVAKILDMWRNGIPILRDVRELFDAQSEFHLQVQSATAEYLRKKSEDGK